MNGEEGWVVGGLVVGGCSGGLDENGLSMINRWID